MCKKLIYLSCIVLLGIINSSMADLVAYYSMDEGSGDIISDGSGNGHDGKLDDTPIWTDGPDGFGLALQFGVDATAGADCGQWIITGQQNIFSATMWIKPDTDAPTGDGKGIIANRTSSSSAYIWSIESSGSTNCYWQTPNGANYDIANLTAGQWQHFAITYDGADLSVYIDGELTNTITNVAAPGDNDPASTVRIGASGPEGNLFNGAIDEVYLFNSVLSRDEIVYFSSPRYPKGPKKPKPGNNETDVSIDVGLLSWRRTYSLISYGSTHNVFLSKDFNDVNDASVDVPLGATVYQDIDVNSVEIPRLEYDTTYYWRVVETNVPPGPQTFVSKIWQFTTEPVGIDLLPENVVDVNVAALEVLYPEQEPNTTCNGSGLDVNDSHSTGLGTMWLGKGEAPGEVWIQYEFDRIYKFHEMLVWNYNEPYPGQDFGARDVNVLYSQDGVTWDALNDIVEFSKATGFDEYEANTTVELDGVIAKYIKLVFLISWTEDAYSCGISEVRFSVIPVRARKPFPENDTNDVAIDTIFSWCKGREAFSHKVYIDSDPNLIAEGTADIVYETTNAAYAPISDLDLATTYYWRIDEVNDNEAYQTWDGHVWSFTTLDSILIEGFEEGYDDSSTNAVWITWHDGYEDTANGSIMGNLLPPYMSENEHCGQYSCPLTYDNTSTATYSEVVAKTVELPIGRSDWSIAKKLTIWIFGDEANIVGDSELYCMIGGKTATYSGSLDFLTTDTWTQWDIDLDILGINLSSIPKITIGIKTVGLTGGSGTILLDDISLSGREPVE